jgi:hypothetical protein
MDQWMTSNMKRLLPTSLLIFTLLTAMLEAQSIPAFPGAEGAGAAATGARAGSLYTVTSLKKDGPGSLAEAVSRPDRIIVFAVSGIIDLEGKKIEITEPNLTIEGQTAPGEGICLAHGTLRVHASNVIVRHLRVRRGYIEEGNSGDAVEINPKDPSYVKPKFKGTEKDKTKENLAIGKDLKRVENVVLDHISASWATDENFTISGHIDRIHAQYCLIAEALDYTNPKQTPPNHAYGSLFGGAGTDTRVGVHHSIFAHHRRRTPQCSAGDGSGTPPVVVDFRNNVVFDSLHAFSHTGGHPIRMNFVGNYYRAGLSTEPDLVGHWFTFTSKSDGAQLYALGNAVHDHPVVTAENWKGILYEGKMKPSSALHAEQPFAAASVTTQTAEAALRTNLAESGATLPSRDAVDLRITHDVRDGTGKVIGKETDLPETQRWPVYRSLPAPEDADKDGLPDVWQKQFGIRDAMQMAQGYAHIEHYCNNTDPTGKGRSIIFVSASVSRASAKQVGLWRMQRTGDLSAALTVPFILGGDALSGTHYVELPSSVIIPAGQSEVSLELKALPASGEKIVTLTLQPSAAVLIGCPAQSLIVIQP